MSVTRQAGSRDRRAERSLATRREILESAWELAHSQGFDALSMRELGAMVGLRAQSLYVYFPSKNAILDAMFSEANAELLARGDAVSGAPVDRLRELSRVFLTFCVEDPVRYQLLFQRPVPGFEPSREAYGPAVRVLARVAAVLADCGITEPTAIDLWAAITSGLAAQQNANDPGGDRWTRLIDDLTDMYLAHYRPSGEHT